MAEAAKGFSGSVTVDDAEVARFDRLANTWWDAKGPMRTLHKFNPVRLTYIRNAAAAHWDRDVADGLPLEGLSILDVGCGGGLLCEPLSRLGASVTGIDPARTNVEVARRHAERSGAIVGYRNETVETLVDEGASFDIVLAMEVVEHVADVDAFVEACCRAVKPGGLLIMATLNRTMKSFALAIVGAEYVLRWLPRGTHEWAKFVTPRELESSIGRNGLAISDRIGVVYNPLADAWRLSSDVGVNYMVLCEKP
jgi:2-polyprenyl-6-hydroxyphenyl methylase/3-demethylubiquinone-9 3-methyltransferase